MDTLSQFGHALKARRAEMGLTQAQVAEMSGLSRQTISQLENGSAPDIGIKKLDRLAAQLGLSLRLELNHAKPRVPPKVTALKRAALSSNVSYKSALSSGELKKILISGKAPGRFEPHLHALLDDAPVSLLASVADQVHKEAHMPREVVWKQLRRLAGQVKSRRDLWK